MRLGKWKAACLEGDEKALGICWDSSYGFVSSPVDVIKI